MAYNNTIKNMNYSRREAADALKISLTTLGELLRREKNPIPAFRVGSKKVLIPVASLEAWLQEEARNGIMG